MSDLELALEQSHKQPILLFKHSTRCPISSMALNRIESSWTDNLLITPYFLDLIAYRSVSNAIASHLGVDHESPQAIVVDKGIVKHHSSHNAIRVSDFL